MDLRRAFFDSGMRWTSPFAAATGRVVVNQARFAILAMRWPRHSFEKRMLEAGLDYGLRYLLMGHKNSRPSYGDGGSIAYRRDELLKIAHPVSSDFVINFPNINSWF